MEKGTQKILNNGKTLIYDKEYVLDAKQSEILANGKSIDYIDYYIYNLSLPTNNITIKFN